MNLIPFDSPTLPAHLGRKGGGTNDLVGNNASAGFPSISIKGKVFHIQRGDERTLITKPGEDDPAASLEVVILRANPDRSKVFYAHGYVEGEAGKPTCYSNNGIAPEANAQEPQAKKCATCAHNQWGSRISDSGAKGKSCNDSRRIAVATYETPNDPMLVRVPAASMRAMEDYGKLLAARGVNPYEVITKIGFDYSVAHPALTFKPVGLIGDAEALAEIKSVGAGDLVARIVGTAPTDASGEPPEDAPAPAQAAKPAPAPAQAAKPAARRVVAAATVEKVVAAAEAAPKVVVAVEKAPAAPANSTASLEADISSMMDGMNFDD